ncbi:mitochondrial export translocase [Blastomyces dermatitidis ER-3]|uniref:Mitochondrial export translocase n=2 Tax=Blastomyces TaxID=229219 RepID=A0A179UE88_BLAGS|nr:mitochondrial export translocase [Blastomyces gilchristii SLH14081]XP_045275105.1 mitochondrial export translocase [Blastomyces dermatitidis ER-3]EEQ87860.1 mitochondrial export translocase [Blastomyces dermatitidis ER-3]EQL28569.1 hypothetical protein BDFG_08717 [Blastomyces dermatitidis ATCC 26199]OAT06335.1 mitochondrial export translocase [Blastomyces gilchristii SLH14081]
MSAPGCSLRLGALRATRHGLNAHPLRVPCSAPPHCAARLLVTTQQRRNFHPSRPTRMVATSIECAHDLLQVVHTYTGLPWVASIPLTAITARVMFGLPFLMWSKSQQNRKVLVAPAMIAYTHMKRKSIMDAAAKKQQFLSPRVVSRHTAVAAAQFKKGLFKRHHLRLSSFAPFAPILQLPFWLAFMESIRSMSGWQPGLLVILQQWFNPNGVKAQVPVESSLSTEGALWFPDLMAADPLGVLPVAISVLMFIHITWGSKINKMKDIPKLVALGNLQGVFSWAIHRIFQAMSIWIAPALLYSQAPAALCIYWLSTTCVAIVQSRLLQMYMPTPNIPMPCRKRTIVRFMYERKPGTQELRKVPRFGMMM